MGYFLIITVILSVLILVYAFIKKKIESTALLASGFIGMVIFISLGDLWYWIYIVLAFFIVGNLVSKYKLGEKQRNGVGQEIRTYENVFGNGGAAVIYCLPYYISHDPIFLYGFLGAMATATADTFATEIGQIYDKQPRLITNPFKKVKVGTSGAVSAPGTVASLAGAFLLSLIPVFFAHHILFLYVGSIAGFIGCIIDSLLGAVVERRYMDKHMVNFCATFMGGLTAVGLAFLLT